MASSRVVLWCLSLSVLMFNSLALESLPKMKECILECTDEVKDPDYACRKGALDPMKDYDGTLQVTENGLQCQPWAAQSPHRHTQKAANMPEKSLEKARNFCRNPDEEDEGPWCYTMDPDIRWERCDIEYCEGYEPFFG